MASYIFMVSENRYPFPSIEERIFVKTTLSAIYKREFYGGFHRFMSSVFDDAKHYEGKTQIRGKKIMSLAEFDQWRKDHLCC